MEGAYWLIGLFTANLYMYAHCAFSLSDEIMNTTQGVRYVLPIEFASLYGLITAISWYVLNL